MISHTQLFHSQIQQEEDQVTANDVQNQCPNTDIETCNTPTPAAAADMSSTSHITQMQKHSYIKLMKWMKSGR